MDRAAPPQAMHGLFELDLDATLETESAIVMPSSATAPAPSARTYDESELRAAEAAAELRGRVAGEEHALGSLIAARNHLLGRIDLALAELSAASAEAAMRLHEPVARTMLAMLRAALPAFAGRCVADDARWILQRIEPALGRGSNILVMASPQEVAAVAAELAEMHGAGARLRIEPEATLVPGEVRIAWDGGGTSHRQAELLATINRILAEFGLTPDPADTADTEG